MQIIVNATFLINTLRTEPEILQKLKLSTIKSVATEIENELGIDINDFKIPIIQTESSKLDLSNDKKERLSKTDINLLGTCYQHRKQCILVSDDILLKNIASENDIKCYTTPEFASHQLKKSEISKPQCVKYLNTLKKIYIRPRDIDKILKRIESW
jgi:rRNA maturation endonuclease Nob1